MKRIAITPILFLFICLLCFAQCKKDKTKTPLEQLPPETQTGANTFGCLVNGQVFKPGGAQLSGGSLQANYQDLGNGPGGGSYLVLFGRFRNNSDGSGKHIGLFADSLRIGENVVYMLRKREKGKAGAEYFVSTTTPFAFSRYTTKESIFDGELFIKKLDTTNQIISGTFRFKATNDTGDIVNVTDGRFDMRYTR